MNRDPFLRLALIALSSVYVLGALVVGIWLGGWVAVAAVVGGILTAAVLTNVLAPKQPEPDPRRRQRQPAEGTRGFERIE